MLCPFWTFHSRVFSDFVILTTCYHYKVGNHSGLKRAKRTQHFLSDFERYNILAICPWNPKQQGRSKKSSNVADSATNLILFCCGFHLQCSECTVWPRNEKKLTNYHFEKKISSQNFTMT